MTTIEKYCAPAVYGTPSYSEASKICGARTMLFMTGQVPYARGQRGPASTMIEASSLSHPDDLIEREAMAVL